MPFASINCNNNQRINLWNFVEIFLRIHTVSFQDFRSFRFLSFFLVKNCATQYFVKSQHSLLDSCHLKKKNFAAWSRLLIFYDFKPNFLLETGEISMDSNSLDKTLNSIINTRVSVQGVESLWDDCRFIPADWGS